MQVALNVLLITSSTMWEVLNLKGNFFTWRIELKSIHVAIVFHVVDYVIDYAYEQLDGQELNPCPAKFIALKNLTVNRNHKFLLNVTTRNGERNSSAYSWFIGEDFSSLP